MPRLRLVTILFVITLLAGGLRQAESQTTGAALVASAEARMKAGDMAGAMTDLTQAIAVDPRNADAYGNRGLLRAAAKDLDGAIEDYTRAIDINPRFAVGYLFRSKARLEKGDHAGSIADAQQVIALLPESMGAFDAQTVLMMAYFERASRQPAASDREKLDAAAKGIEAANALLAWNPDFVDALVYKGLLLRVRALMETNADAQALLVKQAETLQARATQLMDQAKAASPSPTPGDRAAYLKSAEQKWDKGDFEGAVGDLNQAIALNRQDLEALFLRAFLNLAQSRLDDSIIDLTQISSINPNHAPSFAYRGVARLRKNDLSGAMADASRAIELDPKTRLAHRVLLASYWFNASAGSTLNERRRSDAAHDGIRAADAALAALPGDAEALIFKSLFLRAQAGFETDLVEQAALTGQATAFRSLADDLIKAGAEGPVRVGGDIPIPAKVVDVPVTYPDIAKTARVQGVVIMEVLVDGRGRVAETKIIRSIPLLDQAAMAAVRQWVYQPTIVDGMPTLAVFTVTSSFTLQ